jgi:acyl carrier protein
VEELENELKQLIIDALSLKDVDPKDVDASTSLFGDGLGLDSVDVLELGVMLDEKYGIRVKGDDKEHQAAFETVGSLARFVASQRKQEA